MIKKLKKAIRIEKNISFRDFKDLLSLIGLIFMIIFCFIYRLMLFFILALILTEIIKNLHEFEKEKRYLPLKDIIDNETCKFISKRLDSWEKNNKEIYIDRKYENYIKLSEIKKKLSNSNTFTKEEINFINNIFYYNRPQINLIIFTIKLMGVYSNYQI